MAAIYSNGGNRWNILGFNFTKRDALSSVYKISMVFKDNFDLIFVFFSDTHFQSRESHSFLPATFWASVAFLIIGFHLYLVKLIYTECHRETRTGRFAR
jgi:hypothetical protein